MPCATVPVRGKVARAAPAPGKGDLLDVRDRPKLSWSMGPMAGQGRAVESWRLALLKHH